MITRRDALDRRHVGGLAVQVDRQDGARAWSDGAGRRIGIERQPIDLDIGEDRPGARRQHRERRVRRRQRRGDHFIAASDAERPQNERNGVRAGAHTDGVRGVTGGGECRLERFDFGAEHEPAACDHAVDGGADPRQVLARCERDERNPGPRHTRSAARSTRST